MSTVVLQAETSGAAATARIREIEAGLKRKMRGHGGTEGLSVAYQADQDKHGEWQNLGLVCIEAENEEAAQRYKAA